MTEQNEPDLIRSPHLDNLRIACQEYIRFLRDDFCHQDADSEENYRNDIFQAAIEAFFGPDIWEWVSAHIDTE